MFLESTVALAVCRNLARRRTQTADNYYLGGSRPAPGPRPAAGPFARCAIGTGATTVSNKAHAAVVRRVAERFGVLPNGHAEGPDIVLPDGAIEVETSATLASGIERLKQYSGRRYVAVTNRETIADALRLTRDTGIGVLNAQGLVVADAALD